MPRIRTYSTILALILSLVAITARSQTATESEKKEQAEILPLPYEEKVTRSDAIQNEQYWQNQVELDGNNARARLNLVIANRQLGNANFYLYNNAEVISNASTLNMIAPNSFEAEFANYLTNYPQKEGFNALERAASLAPNEKMITGPLMEKALVEHDVSSAQKYARALADENLLDGGLVAVANDVSISIEKRSVLFCEGEMDCYPLFSQQVAIGKPDAQTLIVDRQLLANPEYRQTVWKQLVGAGTPPGSANATVKGICEKSQRTCFLTLSLDRALINDLQADLYVTGNAFQYSSSPISNMAELEENWKKMKGRSTSSALNSNYLVPGIILQNHYKDTGQEKKAQELEQEVIDLAKRNGKYHHLKTAGIIR